MRQTYIVVATADEVALARQFKEYESHPIIITGVGAMNVIRALDPLPRSSWIINIGYAGSADLPIGEVYRIGKSVLLHDVEYTERPNIIGSGVTCYTSTDFVKSNKPGCVFDMELAFICSMGFDHIVAHKKVSDHCNYEEYENNIKGGIV